VCCSVVLQCGVAVCCRTLVSVFRPNTLIVLQGVADQSVLQCVAVCCSVLQDTGVCISAEYSHCVAGCCTSECVAV